MGSFLCYLIVCCKGRVVEHRDGFEAKAHVFHAMCFLGDITESHGLA